MLATWRAIVPIDSVVPTGATTFLMELLAVHRQVALAQAMLLIGNMRYVLLLAIIYYC